jgi:hypothetical protein
MMSFFFLESVEIGYTLVRTPMDVLLLSASLQKQCSCLHICIFMFLGGLCKNLGRLLVYYFAYISFIMHTLAQYMQLSCCN